MKSLLLIPASHGAAVIRNLSLAPGSGRFQEWEAFGGSLNGDEKGFIGFWSDGPDVFRTPAGESAKHSGFGWALLKIDPETKTWEAEFKGISEKHSGTAEDLACDVMKPEESDLRIDSGTVKFAVNKLMLNDFIVSRGWLPGKTCRQMTEELRERVKRGERIIF